jgi:hypothetical protein
MPKAKTTSQVTRKNTRSLVAGKTVAANDVALPTISQEAIATRAYCIYMGEGCPDGRHLDHWNQAVRELSAS